MKIDCLRILDKYLGLPLCVFLSAMKAFCRKGSGSGKAGRILVIKFWGFGSIVLAYDFFQRLRKKFPDAQICALTLEQNRQVFRMCGLFDEVFSIDIKDLPRLLSGLSGLIPELRKKDFDISFDLEFTARFSAIVSCLVNAKRRVGFRYEGIWRGNCFTDTVLFRETLSLKRSFLELAAVVGADIGEALPGLKLDTGGRQEESAVDALLEKELLSENARTVLMNVNASELCLLRRWPKEYFAKLAEGLAEAYGAQIIFIGAQDDAAYVAGVIALVPPKNRGNMHDFSGKLSLPQLAYLIKKTRLFISNDSGPLHLAVYLGVPTVSFFGPETPAIYGPQGSLNSVFYRDFGCSPCIRIKKYKSARCRHDQRCLRDIKPEEVLDEIRRKGVL